MIGKVLTFALLIGLAWPLRATTYYQPTTLEDIHARPRADARAQTPVEFSATVLYFRASENMLYVQDGHVGIYVRAAMKEHLLPGDRIRIRGTMRESFRTWILPDEITVLNHGRLPTPARATFGKLIQDELDCQLVIVHAQVMAADPAWGANGPTYLQMRTDEGYVDAVVDNDAATVREALLDAEVEVTAVATANLDGKQQQTGVRLYVGPLSNVRILKRSDLSLQSLPIAPMDEIFIGKRVHDTTPRERVRGSITYYQPGSFVVLEAAARSVRIMTEANTPLRIGDIADATGFPDLQGGFLALMRGEVRDTGIQAPIRPWPSTWQELSASNHIFDLISTEGQVVAEVRGAAQDEYVLSADGHLFSAFYRLPNTASNAPLPPMKQVRPGSKVRVAGICMLKDANPYNGQLPFDILMRSPDDITILENPSLLTVRNLALVVGLLILIVVAAFSWGWTLKRKVRRQAATLAGRIADEAELERRRSRILEDINGSRAIDEIFQQIAELISFSLGGAPCWCERSDGFCLGQPPDNLDGLRVIRMETPARNGAPSTTFLAGVEPSRSSLTSEPDAFSVGIRLAMLAIETRNLYSDLRHRSEYDLLTDTCNRFSLENRMEAEFVAAEVGGEKFALIYMDLDKFKEVNDRYGHRTGDLYLQQVVLRMKQQLRDGDMLARIGGDEFAVLVSRVRGRGDAEEIAQRLQDCFNEPFNIEGQSISGSTSIGIAVYPEDGVTKDSLQHTADAAMYADKHGGPHSGSRPIPDRSEVA
jgi:diguanylate cyclase (GGDEF)-like protein